jgi:hypothetical protein
MGIKPSGVIDDRTAIVDYLNRQLVGPIGGESETLPEKPHKRYLMGILFPLEAVEDDLDNDTTDEVDNTVSLASEFKPSSMALSFAVTKNAVLKIVLQAGKYDRVKDGRKTIWQRTPLEESIAFDCAAEDSRSQAVLSKLGKLSIMKRAWQDGWILTVALSNTVSSGKVLDAASCLYQSSIYVHTKAGLFAEFPSGDRFKFDDEHEELSLLYRKRVNWAVGHGCASIWDRDSELPAWIKSASIPATEVFGFSTSIDFEKYPDVPKEVLSLQWLANEKESNKKQLKKSLNQFLDAYSAWIVDQINTEIPEIYAEARDRILGRLKLAESRMRGGVEAILSSENALKSFRIANESMLMQMVHTSDKFGGKRTPRNSVVFERPKYFEPEYGDYTWRPFQLAFQLLVIESLVYTDEGDYVESRDIVDLLWFPTGGGKTEAYLALAAWEMIFRRLEDGPKGAGTTVIKRYTLRLLTSQQFQRAGTLICALEAQRRDHVQLLGTTPFSLGLWVGQDLAPNRFSSGNTEYPAAYEKFNFLLDEDKPENPFQLQQCPWCGTSLIPENKSHDHNDYGVRSSVTSFEFFCPTESCDFHDILPIQVVDDALYKTPPSMLIGTVDKFARLAWVDDGRAFFGSGGKYNPPSLIIQDEMHLISGPLGTIAGIYEAGMDALIKQLGGRPKIIAATATIRAASHQARRLFGKEVGVFPPSGMDESDSFFSKEDTKTPGRLYLGIMPSGHTGQTALVQTAAALLQAPLETQPAQAGMDTWWTMPIYHNSRRELGKTMTLSRDDIPDRIKVIASDPSMVRMCDEVEELSANVKGARIPELIERLKQPKGSGGCIDILPCTNMISVGVDISRLGLMLVNGQPKTTAEYIQASSRVGRDKKRPPGIIVTLFSPSKPRDRSHYETFSTYHQSLYRHVEPTSITPWAPPARDRALHAALIILVRLSEHLMANDMAGDFDRGNGNFVAMYENLIARIQDSAAGMDVLEIQKVLDHLDELVSRWHDAAATNDVNRYEAEKTGNQFHPLLKSYGKEAKKGMWSTLNSMRNVDTETALTVKGEL